MRCKIVRFQKLMWRNMMKSTKSQKASVLHYSIDDAIHHPQAHIQYGFNNLRSLTPRCDS